MDNSVAPETDDSDDMFCVKLLSVMVKIILPEIIEISELLVITGIAFSLISLIPLGYLGYIFFIVPRK